MPGKCFLAFIGPKLPGIYFTPRKALFCSGSFTAFSIRAKKTAKKGQ